MFSLSPFFPSFFIKLKVLQISSIGFFFSLIEVHNYEQNVNDTFLIRKISTNLKGQNLLILILKTIQ